MYFERILSEGLAHYSYLIGEGDKTLAIDPRRDSHADSLAGVPRIALSNARRNNL